MVTKHRQLARQVGDSVSSSMNSMAGSSDANSVPKGTTLVFGSWACMADVSGGFSSHLITPKSPESKTTNQLARECAFLEVKLIALKTRNPESLVNLLLLPMYSSTLRS